MKLYKQITDRQIIQTLVCARQRDAGENLFIFYSKFYLTTENENENKHANQIRTVKFKASTRHINLNKKLR